MDERVKKLRYEQEGLIKNLDSKVKYRLNLVPKKFWDIKLKDVIDLERNQKVTFGSLLTELAAAKNSSQTTKPRETQPQQQPKKQLPQRTTEPGYESKRKYEEALLRKERLGTRAQRTESKMLQSKQKIMNKLYNKN